MKTRKILAILLTMAMVMSFTSITAFAADEAGAMTAVSADFATTQLDDPIVAENIVTSVKGSASATDDYTVPGLDATAIPVTREFLTGNNLVLTVTDGTASDGAPQGFKFTVADDPAEDGPITVADIAAGNAFAIAGGAVEIGDVIYVVDGYDDGADDAAVKIAKFVVTMSEGGSLSGDATKKSPIYNVKVPTTLGYAIDPLQIGTISVDESQIASGTFAFANASNVPVKVTVDLTATVQGTLKDSAWNPTNATTGAPKELKLALIGAVSTNGTPTLANPADGTQTYTQSDDVNTLRWFDTEDKDASIDFLLAPGTGIAVGSTPKNNVGMFQIYAQMETYARWVAGDIKLSGTYTLQGFKTSDYAEPAAAVTGDNTANDPATKLDETADTTFDGYDAWNGGIPGTVSRADATELVGLNVMPGGVAVSAYGFGTATGLVVDGTPATGFDASATFTYAKANQATAFIPFGFGSADIDSIWTEGITPAWANYDGTATFPKVTGGIGFDSNYNSAMKFNMYISLDNGDKFKVVVTVTD